MFELGMIFGAIFIWLPSVIYATSAGAKKGVPILGFINGFLLGPIGVLFVMMQDDENRIPCPKCAESIFKTAKICPHCQQEVLHKTPASPHF